MLSSVKKEGNCISKQGYVYNTLFPKPLSPLFCQGLLDLNFFLFSLLSPFFSCEKHLWKEKKKRQ